MSRARFTALLVLLALVVGTGSFALATSVLDDGGPDAPPERTGEGSSAGGTSTSTTSTTAAAGPITTGELDSPSFILVVSSDAPDEAGAAAIAEQVAADGHPAGVLRSDDYPSLNPGFWVAYAGPYEDLAAAEGAVAQLEADGWSGAYPRCAGTDQDCGGGQQDGDSEDSGDSGDEDD